MGTTIGQAVVGLATAAAIGLATMGPAIATDFSILVPADAAALRPISWTGFMISPSIGHDTLKFHGSGSPALKSARGFGVGATIGYDVHVGGVVYGVVGNILGANINGDSTDGQPNALKSRLDAYGMVRARIGLPFDRVLVFGTVGVAAGRLQIENQPLGLSDRQTLTGWAGGAGLEYVYNRSVTIRAEYIRVELGERSFSSLKSGAQDVGGVFDMFKVGLVTRY